MQNGKVFKDLVFSCPPFFDEDGFHACLREICDKLDIATPRRSAAALFELRALS